MSKGAVAANKRKLAAKEKEQTLADTQVKKIVRKNSKASHMLSSSDSENERSDPDSETDEYELAGHGRDAVLDLTSKDSIEIAENIKSKRLSYDKKTRGDENGMKNTLLYTVWSNNYHLEGTQAENFKKVAAELAESKPLGISTFSADSLAKKYKEILRDVQDSIKHNYIGGGAGHDNDEADSDDSAKRTKFSGTMPFERIGRRILRESERAKELKMLAKTEKIQKDNTLSAKEDAVLQRMQGTFTPSNKIAADPTGGNTSASSSSGDASGSGGSRGHSGSSGSSSNAHKPSKYEADMSEFTVMMKQYASPLGSHQATTTATSSTRQKFSAEAAMRELTKRDVTTTQEVLELVLEEFALTLERLMCNIKFNVAIQSHLRRNVCWWNPLA